MGEYDIDKIKDYLQLTHPIQIKSDFWMEIIFFDIFAFPAIFIGSPPILIKAMILPTVALNIWRIIIQLDVERWQKNYVLFDGVYSTVLSIIFLMLSYRFYMLNSKANEKIFLSLIITISLLVLRISFALYNKLLTKGCRSKKKKKKQKNYAALLAIIPPLGLSIGKVCVRMMKDQDVVVVYISILFLIMAFVYEFIMIHLYRYYLICKYEEELAEDKLKKNSGTVRRTRKKDNESF